jgi:hypothetical protein
MDELLDSGNVLAYQEGQNYIFDCGDETEGSQVQGNRVNFPSFLVCVDWANYENVSILLIELDVEEPYAVVNFVGENSQTLVCALEDGVFYTNGQSKIMLHGDPLMKRVTEIIDRVVEACLHNYWISITMNKYKLLSRKIAIVNPFDGYYSFNLYHMQPAFYLLWMGWCISVICLWSSCCTIFY